MKMGELDAAEDSYAVVAERVEQPDWRYAAFETLAHISALRGHPDVFDERVARADGTGWKTAASVPVHAQILQFRAMSWKALGDPVQARVWLERARDYAQEHAVNQVLFEAEALLAGLDNDKAASTAGVTAAEAASTEPGLPAAEMEEIRGGVGAMRRALGALPLPELVGRHPDRRERHPDRRGRHPDQRGRHPDRRRGTLPKPRRRRWPSRPNRAGDEQPCFFHDSILGRGSSVVR